MTSLQHKLRTLKQWDDQRPSLPGEHWFVLGAGLLLMRRAGQSRSLVRRMLGRTLGSALLARAASGRDGIVGRIARAGGARR